MEKLNYHSLLVKICSSMIAGNVVSIPSWTWGGRHFGQDTVKFFTLGVSVRLSDRFKVTQNKINFVENCPQWG